MAEQDSRRARAFAFAFAVERFLTAWSARYERDSRRSAH